jgi:peptidoglycan/LPS O-acetylase OafA/YrhL
LKSAISPVPTEPRRDHVAALTSLRFVAALLVLLFHFHPVGAGWDVVAGEGHVGVSIFFVLSGYLITARYADAFARHAIDVRLYFVRRAARILPLYYFILVASQLVSPGRIEVSGRLPEWTLTQALFGESLHDFVIPTSWSLTVEECFYALAPLVFLSVAALRRRLVRFPLGATAATLALWTSALFAAGVAVWTVLDGTGPGFLRRPESVTLHTIFGRFYDFAVGTLAAYAYGRATPRGLALPLPGALATAAGAALVYLSQWGMHEAGGIEGSQWAQAWVWDLLLAPATALVIVSLSAARNPLARVLGVGPLVYLGKASYALYLVQLTPLGRGFLYRFVSREDGNLTVAVLVLGMIALSVLLYELVEEPARRLVLRLAGDPQGEPARGTAWGTGLLAALSLAVLVGGWALLVGPRLGPVSMDEVRAATTERSVHAVSGNDLRRGRDVHLVGVPRRWREGWGDDLRAPRELLVYVEGRQVPFTRHEPSGHGEAAFYRGPRAEYLALRTAAAQDVVLVNLTPALGVAVRLNRLGADAPAALVVLALVSLLVAVLAARAVRSAHRGRALKLAA